jgi:hypothetical protein
LITSPNRLAEASKMFRGAGAGGGGDRASDQIRHVRVRLRQDPIGDLGGLHAFSSPGVA